GRLGRDVLDRPVGVLRVEPRPVPPGLADDRLRAGSPRIRAEDLPRAREGHGDRSRRPLAQRNDLAGNGLADPSAAWARPGRPGEVPRRAVPRRLRRGGVRRARGSTVREDAGARRTRLPDREGRAAALPALTANWTDPGQHRD